MNFAHYLRGCRGFVGRGEFCETCRLSKKLHGMKKRFARVGCSMCGREFPAADAGYSSCSEHALKLVDSTCSEHAGRKVVR